jgi:hypothetical protein
MNETFYYNSCGKGFMDKQKLQIHTRIHTGLSTTCLSIKSHETLITLFTKLGERPHICHICPQVSISCLIFDKHDFYQILTFDLYYFLI